MATKTKEEILSEIKNHINKSGGITPSWFVGISNNAVNQLFDVIKVDRENSWWIYRTAETDDIAKSIKKELISNGISDDASSSDGKVIYAYKKK